VQDTNPRLASLPACWLDSTDRCEAVLVSFDPGSPSLWITHGVPHKHRHRFCLHFRPPDLNARICKPGHQSNVFVGAADHTPPPPPLQALYYLALPYPTQTPRVPRPRGPLPAAALNSRTRLRPAPFPPRPRDLRPHLQMARPLLMATSLYRFGAPMNPSTALHLVPILCVLVVCLALVTHRLHPNRRHFRDGLGPRTAGSAAPRAPPPPPLFPATLTDAWMRPVRARMAAGSGHVWTAAVRYCTPETSWNPTGSAQLTRSHRAFFKMNNAITRIVRALAKCGCDKIPWGTDNVIYAWHSQRPHSKVSIYIGRTTGFTGQLHEHLTASAQIYCGTAIRPIAASTMDHLHALMGRHGVAGLVMIPLEIVHDWDADSAARQRWWVRELCGLALCGANT